MPEYRSPEGGEDVLSDIMREDAIGARGILSMGEPIHKLPA